ncbi:MAG TPA: ethanolamine ammonia-lyase reactivating factor EutA [Tenuifilaceae bacterium]|nr:ethanolamine ammonia-lyase reactivating factor EutA [Tenuifilaceae bacterium]
MKLLKFAAIDIGSNAVRLLLSNVVENGDSVVFRKSSLIRMPIRLGEDAFETGIISEARIQKLIKTMIAYRNLMEVEDVVAYRACATSAMREALNAPEIVERVSRQTGVNIEVINGRQEAEIVYSNGIAETLDSSKPFIYVDVGGGSTEISLFQNGQNIASQSFDIGTIRMLKEKVGKSEFDLIKKWLKNLKITGGKPKIIGSGGNINKLYRLAGKVEGRPLSFAELQKLFAQLKSYTFEDRISILGMNPDRADVIIPAARIYLKTMEWTGASKILVPTIGVSDGIVRMLYRDYRGRS